GETWEGDRFSYIAVGAGLITTRHVLFLAGRGEHHYRDAPGAGIGTHPSKHFEAVELGQLEVEQDYPRLIRIRPLSVFALTKQKIRRSLTIPRYPTLLGDLGATQRPHGQFLILSPVLYEQNRFFRHDLAPCPFSLHKHPRD